MEKGDKPKKKAARKPKQNQKQKQKQTTNQKVNVHVTIGGHPEGKKAQIKSSQKDQPPTRASKIATPKQTNPPQRTPQIIVRNFGDPIQTIASYAKPQAEIPQPPKESKVPKTQNKSKKEIPIKEEKKPTHSSNLSYRDWVSTRESEPKNMSPLTAVSSPMASTLTTSLLRRYEIPMHVQGDQSGDDVSAISRIFRPLGRMSDFEDESNESEVGLRTARKRGGVGGGSQKDEAFYGAHPELLDMSPRSQRRAADTIRKREKRAAGRGVGFAPLPQPDIGGGLLRDTQDAAYYNTDADDDEDDS